MFEPQFTQIEKIKIIGSTFMAACGLRSGQNSQDLDGETEPFSKERLNFEFNPIKMKLIEKLLLILPSCLVNDLTIG